MQSGATRNGRQDAIRGYLYAHGAADVGALAAALGASPATIRRDLHDLEDQGVVDRTHGGARIAEGAKVEVAFEQRALREMAAKRAIAACAYRQLKPRSTVFLDAGTTVLQLARLLKLSPLPLRVFTNGLAVAQELMQVDEIELSLLGGQMRRQNLSTTGAEAEAMLDTLWFDQLMLGASAIGRDGLIYGLDSAEASLNRHMLRRAGTTLLLADATKFGASATFRVAPLDGLGLVTDARLAAHWRQMIEDHAIPTTYAPMDAT